jgi:hypothetical protein
MSLIYNKDIIKEFIKDFYKPMQDNEVGVIQLFTRNKYLKNTDYFESGHRTNQCIEQVIIKSIEPDYIINRIARLNVNVELHDKPVNAYVFYLSINYYDTIKSYFNLQKDMNDKLYNVFNNDKVAIKGFRSLNKNYISCLMKNSIKKDRWYDLDVDTKDKQFIQDLETELFLKNKYRDIIYKIETNGGYHYLFKFKDFPEQNRKTVYADIKTFNKCLKETLEVTDKDLVELNSNSLIPIPGTLQGGFEVKYNKLWIKESY